MRWMFGLAIGIAAAMFAYIVYGYCFDQIRERNFDRVKNGMNEQQVLSLMGKPDSIGRCGKLGGVPDGCYKEFLYQPVLPTISTWAIFFDSQGLSIEKYEYMSP